MIDEKHIYAVKNSRKATGRHLLLLIFKIALPVLNSSSILAAKLICCPTHTGTI
jgi:hypothetical protein